MVAATVIRLILRQAALALTPIVVATRLLIAAVIVKVPIQYITKIVLPWFQQVVIIINTTNS